MKSYRILSLDGGGTRTLISLLWLCHLQERLSQPLHHYFDSIAGISSGSIVACQLAAGVGVQQILEQWLRDAPRLFSRSKNRGWGWFNKSDRTIYDDVGLNTSLQEKFGDLRFGDLHKVPTIVTSYDSLSKQVVVFNNSNPVHAELPVWEICRASAALPFFFPPHNMVVEGQPRVFMDGAVVGRSPAISAIAAALAHHRYSNRNGVNGRVNGRASSSVNGNSNAGATATSLQTDQILLASVGTAVSAQQATPSLLKALSGHLSTDVLHAAVEGTPEVNHLAAQEILAPENYFRFQLDCRAAHQSFVSKLDCTTQEHCQALTNLVEAHVRTPEGQSLLERLSTRLEASSPPPDALNPFTTGNLLSVVQPVALVEATAASSAVAGSAVAGSAVSGSAVSSSPASGSAASGSLVSSSPFSASLVPSHPAPSSPASSASASGYLVSNSPTPPSQGRLWRLGCVGAGMLATVAVLNRFEGRWFAEATVTQPAVIPVVQENQPSNLLMVDSIPARPEWGYQIQRSYTGQLSSQRTSELGFEQPGKVVQLLANPGETVKAGAPLAYLNEAALTAQAGEIAAQRAQAIAQLEELRAGATAQSLSGAAARLQSVRSQLLAAQQRYDRRQALHMEGAISQEQLSEAGSQVDALKSQEQEVLSQLEELRMGARPEQIKAQEARIEQINAAAEQLKIQQQSLVLKAPFSGTIADRWVDEGTVVNAGQPLYRLVESGRLEGRVEVPIATAQQMAVGSSQSIDIGGTPYSARVQSILPEVNASTGQATVVLHIDAKNTLPGQMLSLHLNQTVETQGFWLPSTALVKGVGGLWTCYVLTPDADQPSLSRIQPQSVEVLHTEADRVFVRGTLQANDRVVTSGTQRLVPQQLVQATSTAEL